MRRFQSFIAVLLNAFLFVCQSVFALEPVDFTHLAQPVGESDLESTMETMTYVRCWYREANTHDDVKTAWQWALKEDGSYYQIAGYWYSNDFLKNMFYTDVPQSDIMAACQRSIDLTHDKLDITFFAADTSASFNYTIWTNDQATNLSEGKINKIVSFGDSLSDTGNVFNGSFWLFPNRNSWFLGHFSNGLLWTEYLAKTMRVPLYNWAIGTSGSTDQYFFLKGIKSQLVSFERYMKLSKNYHPENTLFTLEFGLNDFLLFNTPLDEVKQHFDETLDKLVKLHAKHIVIMLVPDASRIPGYKKVDKNLRLALRKKIISYNDHIKQKIGEYQAMGVNIITFDVFHLLEKLHENPKKYGFDNVTDACLDIKKTDTSVYFSSYHLTDACQEIGSDKYVFWGNTHPTTMAHQYFSSHLLKQMKTSFNFKTQTFLKSGRYFFDRFNHPVLFPSWDGTLNE